MNAGLRPAFKTAGVPPHYGGSGVYRTGEAESHNTSMLIKTYERQRFLRHGNPEFTEFVSLNNYFREFSASVTKTYFFLRWRL
jgi:hypothetical protein